MYDILLVDIDNTIFNFDIAEDKAIHVALKHYDIEPTDEVVNKFKTINKSLWKKFELGEITKERLLAQRFEELFAFLGKMEHLKNNISSEVNAYYLNQLSNSSDLMPDAYEVLEELSKTHKIYPVTNAVYKTQTKRINNSTVKQFFNGVYISEVIGVQKPYQGFFDFVFNDLKITDKSKLLMVGDSLIADIVGGIKYG
ncbi:MAG: YjjG family noncanonical pyrimidine nucleotidase, partial [Bacilli bacterium]|nr:YjjG family noncanonical pyrimidine nucleotidase [Bacilli bacterium]